MQLVSWQVVVNVDGLVQNVTIRAVCSSVVSTIAALRQLLNRVVISSVKNAENEDVIRIASQNSGTRSYVELLTGSGGSGPNVIGLFGSLTSGGGAAHRGTNFYSGVGDDSPVYRFGSFYDFDLQQHKVQLTLENASAYYVRVDSYWTGGTEVLPAGVGHTAEQMRGDCGGGADRMRTHSAELDFANYLVPGATSPLWTPALSVSVHSVKVYNLSSYNCTAHAPACYARLAAGSPGTELETMAIGALYDATENSIWSFSDLPGFLRNVKFVQTLVTQNETDPLVPDWLCFTTCVVPASVVLGRLLELIHRPSEQPVLVMYPRVTKVLRPGST